MATVVSDGDTLSIGRDFADAVSGQRQSSGTLRLHHLDKTYVWQSTLPVSESETAIRSLVKAEKRTVLVFTSQAA